MIAAGAAAAVVAGTAQSNPHANVRLSADSTALILCGTTCPTPDDYWIESVKNTYVGPTHPGQDLDYVAVTAPMQFWPITGLFRLLGLAFGPSEIFGLNGSAWPDESWWRLSGLFDLTANQSLAGGVADLQAAMSHYGNNNLVIYGNSQGAGVANVVKKKLGEQYPVGAIAPDIDFVLRGDPNLPNGGLMSRFPGLYIPILDLTFNGAAATGTQFDTVEINQQYDGFSDFPLYPLNLIADLNAILGVLYLHTRPFAVSLPTDPTTSPAYQGTHGDTSYYFFETADLPLFEPLRSLGVPEKLIDVVEPVFRVLVELGYDRRIPPWQPTPARLIPHLDPVTVLADLANAVGEGINNALAIVGGPHKQLAPEPTVVAATAAPEESSLPNDQDPIEGPPEPTEGGRSPSRSQTADSTRESSTPKKVNPVGRSARPQPRRDPANSARAAQPSAASSTGGSARHNSGSG